MTGRSKEIRRILVGYLTVEGDYIVAGKTIVDHLIQGAYAGTLSARLFGLSVRKRQYRVSNVKLADVRELCPASLAYMGSPVKLESAPDAAAVLTIPWLFNPCVMTAEADGKDMLVCFYTARTLFAFLNARRAFRQWLKIMEGIEVKRVDVTMTPADLTEKNEKKKEKKSRRRKDKASGKSGSD